MGCYKRIVRASRLIIKRKKERVKRITSEKITDASFHTSIVNTFVDIGDLKFFK
jgi:hypothetical protein